MRSSGYSADYSQALNMSVLVTIALVTFAFSFGIQALYYLRYFVGGRKIIREHKVVFAYKSGIVGDGVLIPATNVVAWLVLQGLDFWYTNLLFLLSSAVGGLFITFLFHWGQQRFGLTNWTMPTPGHWTLLGVYHAIFMFCESSFLCFVLFNYLGQLVNAGQYAVVNSPLGYGILILFLFLVTFVHDYWQPFFAKIFGKPRRPLRGEASFESKE